MTDDGGVPLRRCRWGSTDCSAQATHVCPGNLGLGHPMSTPLCGYHAAEAIERLYRPYHFARRRWPRPFTATEAERARQELAP